MKVKDLKLKPESELRNLLVETRTKLGSIKMNLTNKSKDTSEIRKLRKDIARILTLLKLTNKK